MNVKVILDGNEYMSKTDLKDAEEVANLHYKDADTFVSFMMELANGGFMVLGPEACKSAVFIYIP